MGNNILKKSPGKVTIVVVCYNASPEHICYTFESIITQDYPDKELVVVDGGSEEKTIKALQGYLSHISHLISEPDEGVYNAMNKGIIFSTGEWICFMNIGDRFHTNQVLSTMLSGKNLRTNPALINGDSVLCDSFQIGRIEYVPKTITRWFLYHGTICHQAMIVRKTTFEKVGLFNTSYKILSDKDWLFRLLDAGFSYCHSDIVVCDWDVRGLSSNPKLFKREWNDVVKKRYSKPERFLYMMFWVLFKSAKRLRSLNFTLPKRLGH